MRGPAADDRPVDSGAKIIIAPDPTAPAIQRVAPLAPRTPTTPAAGIAQPRQGGLGFVILLYILSAGALAYAIYDEGPPLEDCDLITVSVPLPVAKKAHQLASDHATRLDRGLLDPQQHLQRAPQDRLDRRQERRFQA